MILALRYLEATLLADDYCQFLGNKCLEDHPEDSERFRLLPYTFLLFTKTVRAGFEPTIAWSKHAVFPITPTDYKTRHVQIAILAICIKREPLPANRVFGVYLALSGSATSVPVCFSIG